MGVLSAEALIDSLTAGVREAFPFIKSLSESSLSANKIIEEVRSAGMAVQRSDALKLIRTLRENEIVSKYIKSVRNDFMPNPERFATAVTDIIRNYSYEVRINGTHAKTRERVTKWVTISTNVVLSKDQVMGYAGDIAEGETESGQVIDFTMTVTNALRAPGVVF